MPFLFAKFHFEQTDFLGLLKIKLYWKLFHWVFLVSYSDDTIRKLFRKVPSDFELSLVINQKKKKETFETGDIGIE